MILQNLESNKIIGNFKRDNILKVSKIRLITIQLVMFFKFLFVNPLVSGVH